MQPFRADMSEKEQRRLARRLLPSRWRKKSEAKAPLLLACAAIDAGAKFAFGVAFSAADNRARLDIIKYAYGKDRMDFAVASVEDDSQLYMTCTALMKAEADFDIYASFVRAAGSKWSVIGRDPERKFTPAHITCLLAGNSYSAKKLSDFICDFITEKNIECVTACLKGGIPPELEEGEAIQEAYRTGDADMLRLVLSHAHRLRHVGPALMTKFSSTAAQNALYDILEAAVSKATGVLLPPPAPAVETQESAATSVVFSEEADGLRLTSVFNFALRQQRAVTQDLKHGTLHAETIGFERCSPQALACARAAFVARHGAARLAEIEKEQHIAIHRKLLPPGDSLSSRPGAGGTL